MICWSSELEIHDSWSFGIKNGFLIWELLTGRGSSGCLPPAEPDTRRWRSPQHSGSAGCVCTGGRRERRPQKPWHQLQPRSPGSRTRKPADPAVPPPSSVAAVCHRILPVPRGSSAVIREPQLPVFTGRAAATPSSWSVTAEMMINFRAIDWVS